MTEFHDFWQPIIEYEMSFFETYLKEMEQALQERYAGLKREWENFNKEGGSYEYEDHLIESNDEIERHFGIFYSSFIITLFGFVEYEFDRTCRRFSIRNKSKFILKDIYGRGIYRAKTFMKKVCNFDLPSEDLWKELEGINKVRNCLVHSNGEINRGNKDLINYVKRSKKIKIKESPVTKIKTIRITKEYCSFAIGIIEEYLLALTEKNAENM